MNESTTSGIDAPSAAYRTQRFRQRILMIRMNRSILDLYRDNPMPSQVEGELLVQPFYERRPVLIEEGDEADRALLRVAAGAGQRAGMHELTPQRFVAPLRCLDHLAVQRLQIVLHAAERRSGGAFERRIEGGDGLDQPMHLFFNRLRRGGKRFFDDRWNLRAQQ